MGFTVKINKKEQDEAEIDSKKEKRQDEIQELTDEIEKIYEMIEKLESKLVKLGSKVVKLTESVDEAKQDAVRRREKWLDEHEGSLLYHFKGGDKMDPNDATSLKFNILKGALQRCKSKIEQTQKKVESLEQKVDRKEERRDKLEIKQQEK